jgi:hypothetical protein
MSVRLRIPQSEWFVKVFRLSPNYFAFLGGVFISSSVNLYTSALTADPRPQRVFVLLAAAACMFVSGFAWTAIAWNLEPIFTIARAEGPTSIEGLAETLSQRLLARRLPRLVGYLACGCLIGALGLFLLAA